MYSAISQWSFGLMLALLCRIVFGSETVKLLDLEYVDNNIENRHFAIITAIKEHRTQNENGQSSVSEAYIKTLGRGLFLRGNLLVSGSVANRMNGYLKKARGGLKEEQENVPGSRAIKVFIGDFLYGVGYLRSIKHQESWKKTDVILFKLMDTYGDHQLIYSDVMDDTDELHGKAVLKRPVFNNQVQQEVAGGILKLKRDSWLGSTFCDREGCFFSKASNGIPLVFQHSLYGFMTQCSVEKGCQVIVASKESIEIYKPDPVPPVVTPSSTPASATPQKAVYQSQSSWWDMLPSWENFLFHLFFFLIVCAGFAFR